eukprot:PhF_6_TR10358/c0_g2_i2/m.16043
MNPNVDPTALLNRCLALESETHKLHLQIEVIRAAFVKSIRGDLTDREKESVLDMFRVAGGHHVSQEVDGICDVCFKKGAVHSCSNCKKALFCSIECELAVLKDHFTFCQAWREQTLTTKKE